MDIFLDREFVKKMILENIYEITEKVIEPLDELEIAIIVATGVLPQKVIENLTTYYILYDNTYDNLNVINEDQVLSRIAYLMCGKRVSAEDTKDPYSDFCIFFNMIREEYDCIKKDAQYQLRVSAINCASDKI